MNERRFGTSATRGFKQIQSAHSIHFEIVERNRGSSIVRRLPGRMNDYRGLQLRHQAQNCFAVTDIRRVVRVAIDLTAKPSEYPTRISFGTKEYGALVVVNPGDSKPESMKIDANFRT